MASLAIAITIQTTEKLDKLYCAWLSEGLLCLYSVYIEKVEIWSGVTDPSQTHTDIRI